MVRVGLTKSIVGHIIEFNSGRNEQQEDIAVSSMRNTSNRSASFKQNHRTSIVTSAWVMAAAMEGDSK